MEQLWDTIRRLPLARITRVDVALEGDWNATVTTVWTAATGWDTAGSPELQHPELPPAVELYFESSWFGFRCYREKDGVKMLDAAALEQSIELIESTMRLS